MDEREIESGLAVCLWWLSEEQSVLYCSHLVCMFLS